MTNDGEHDASPWLDFSISTLPQSGMSPALSCQPRIAYSSSINAASFFIGAHNEAFPGLVATALRPQRSRNEPEISACARSEFEAWLEQEQI
jgi:NO-binding membrane sensor protein with MHYT domain